MYSFLSFQSIHFVDFLYILQLLISLVKEFVVIAEFIIMLGKKSKNVDKFKTRLGKNGADFPVSYRYLELSCNFKTFSCYFYHKYIFNSYAGDYLPERIIL